MQDNELFKKKRRPFSPETVDSRRKRAPLLITWHYSTGQGQCQMKISAKGREVLLRPSHPLGPKTEGWLVYAKAGGQISVCRVNKLTIDNEQLTIMVSLRDELKLFLNYFRRKFLNCQLSIRQPPIYLFVNYPLICQHRNAAYFICPPSRMESPGFPWMAVS